MQRDDDGLGGRGDEHNGDAVEQISHKMLIYNITHNIIIAIPLYRLILLVATRSALLLAPLSALLAGC